MSVYSMTGFGNADASTRDSAESGTSAAATVAVELRSVNSRFLDLAFRLPDEMRGFEPALRELLVAAFRRGKIELRASAQQDAEGAWPRPTAQQLMALSHTESAVLAWLPKAAPLSVGEVLQWCRGGSAGAAIEEPLLAATRAAITALQQARQREGERLAALLQERIARLRELAAQAAPLLPAVVQRQRERSLERWREALGAADASQAISVDALQERALNEAAAFAIRIDVAEELNRLVAHLDEIERLLAKGGEAGKRLDFLIQELQREANTLGSKSAALELTAIAVEMKVAVEQMREQVQNIE